MLYTKNSVTITGQVVCLGLKYKEINLALVLVNTKNIIPINVSELNMNLKLNSFIDIVGEIVSKDSFTYVNATKVENSKTKSLKHHVEITGVLLGNIKGDLYSVEINKNNIVAINIPFRKPGIIQLGTVVNMKAEFKSMNYINRNTVNLESSKLICSKYTNI